MRIENACKIYKDRVVFQNLNIDLEARIYHVKGHNGVGKSVLCRCLLGLEELSEGKIKDGFKDRILFLPEAPLGEDWLSMEENIELLLYYYGILIDDSDKKSIYEQLEISELNQNYHTVSVGTSMKIGMFLLFLKNEWNLIIIDEALSHLDTSIRNKIFLELEKRAKEGTIVLMVDHSFQIEKANDIWKEIVLEG
jgi:ABC-2 type transport system ATP-binding protein